MSSNFCHVLKKTLKLLAIACCVAMMSACSDSSGDEPDDNSTKAIQQLQQDLQREFLNDGKNGISLSAGATEAKDVYDDGKLYDLLLAPYNSGFAEEDMIGGVPSPFCPMCPMRVLGCEPFIPFVGVCYEPAEFGMANYNVNPYPLVAEGGEIQFPAVNLTRGSLSMKDYSITDFYVQENGETVSKASRQEFPSLKENSEYIEEIVDDNDHKLIRIRDNKTDRQRTFWFKFVNPNCEYVYNGGENVIYLQIRQEATK